MGLGTTRRNGRRWCAAGMGLLMLAGCGTSGGAQRAATPGAVGRPVETVESVESVEASSMSSTTAASATLPTAATTSEATMTQTRIAYGPDDSQFGVLWLPANVVSLLPVVALVHGGFWRAQYGLDLMDPLADDLVRRGFAVWNIEYRRVGQQGGGWPGTLVDVGAAIDELADVAAASPIDLARARSSATRPAVTSRCGPRVAPNWRRPHRAHRHGSSQTW